MRLPAFCATLVAGACFAACSTPPAPEPELSPEHQAVFDRAKAELAAIKEAAAANEADKSRSFDRTAACRSLFASKRSLLDLQSARLQALWGAADAVCLTTDQRFHVDRVSHSLRHIASHAADQDFDPQYFCLSASQARRALGSCEDPSVDRLLAAADTTCGLDAWLTFAAHRLQKATVAQKTRAPSFPEECAYVRIALESIHPRFVADPRVAELRAQDAALCASTRR